MTQVSTRTAIALGAILFVVAAQAEPLDVSGVKVSLDTYQGPATLATQSHDKFKIQVSIDRKGDSGPLALRVELPKTGRNIWPAEDVEVRDSRGMALLVQRSGIEWEKMRIPLPADVTACMIQAVEPPDGWPQLTTESDRTIQDHVTGMRIRIAKWDDGRTAALSIRFDDSHPTHLSKAVPILREYGFRGTFMVNPGPAEPGSRRVSEFDRHRAAWEAVAKQGDHELANHSAHHRGASGDEDMDAEIGRAAEVIWELTSGKSKLTALNLGGGTRWETTRTLRHYLAKYHQFDASSGSLGMDDSYGGRVAAFRRMLEQHIARGLWCRIHYHYLGDGLSSSEANFRAALDIAKEHQDELWIAGMADIHKYQAERGTAKLTLVQSTKRSLTFKLACTTDPNLYDQSLTLEIMSPPTWPAHQLTVTDAHGVVVPTKRSQAAGAAVWRILVLPREATYVVAAAP